MAALSTYIAYPEIKSIYRARYAQNGYFVNWANQLLEELEGRGFLSTTIKEVGQTVHDQVWIKKPSDLVALQKIYDPEDWDHAFRTEDVNNEFKLMDDEFRPIDDSVLTASAFATLTSASVACQIPGIVKDQFKGYLMLFTAGTKAGSGVILSGNDDSVPLGESVYTTVRFVNTQSLIGTDFTACEFIEPGQYVMIRYVSLINLISSVGDEFPIPDDCEARLVPTWLRWCIEKEALSTSKETVWWGTEAFRLIEEIDAKRSSKVNPAKGRRLVGLERRGCSGKDQPSYDDCIDAAEDNDGSVGG